MKKNQQTFTETLNQAEETTKKWQILHKKCNKVPNVVRRDMNEAGMLLEDMPEKDNYINEGALEVVLDRELYNDNPKKFMHYLKKAIKNRLDNDVFGVIDEFHNVKNVMNIIVSSNVSEYVSKVVKKPIEI